MVRGSAWELGSFRVLQGTSRLAPHLALTFSPLPLFPLVRGGGSWNCSWIGPTKIVLLSVSSNVISWKRRDGENKGGRGRKLDRKWTESREKVRGKPEKNRENRESRQNGLV
jgi:hypothetical protein